MSVDRFTFDRSCVARIASGSRMRAALAATASDVAAQARAGDPRGDYRTSPVTTNLAGLTRSGWRVQDEAPDAARREFGTGSTPGRRTLGRIAGRRG